MRTIGGVLQLMKKWRLNFRDERLCKLTQVDEC